MREVVLIPWRGGQHDRDVAFERLWHTQWSPMNLPVYTGDSGHRPFHRGASRNDAAVNAGDWDVALFADADVILDPGNVRRALQLAAIHDVVVFPHDRYQALDKNERPARTSTAPTNGGALAINRASWARIGGYDERFAGWGYEDAAFRLATETLLGIPIRVPGYMRELHHRKTLRIHDLNERALFERYKRAYSDPEDMERLVSEARAE